MIITSTGNTLQSKFDLRFGRTGWFCVYNTEDKTADFVPNENKNANGGAGTKAAEMAAELDAKSVISGDFGPKAKTLLEQLEIQMIIMDGENKTIQDIIDTIKN